MYPAENARVPIPPSTEEIVENMISKIRNGTWPYETKIPTHAELADSYDVSVSTISRVVARLKADGWLIGRGGRGVWVTPER